MKGRCGHNESELQVSWVDGAYTLKLLFVKVTVTKGFAEKGYRLRENMDSGHPSVDVLFSFLSLPDRKAITLLRDQKVLGG